MTKFKHDRWLLTLLDDAKRARRNGPSSDHQGKLTSDKPDPDTQPCNPYLDDLDLRTQSKVVTAYTKSKAAFEKKEDLLKSGGIVPFKTERLAGRFEGRRLEVLLCSIYLQKALREEYQKTGTANQWVELMNWWSAMHRREFGNSEDMQRTIENAFDLLSRITPDAIAQATLEDSP